MSIVESFLDFSTITGRTFDFCMRTIARKGPGQDADFDDGEQMFTYVMVNGAARSAAESNHAP